MALVVDDHLLIDLLAGELDPSMAKIVDQSAIYTTGSWYYRVAVAAQRGSAQGSLSKRIQGLAEPVRSVVISGIADLPDTVGLIGPRTVVPVMAGLALARRPNFLTAEAVAVAVLTEASVAVRTDTPLLREACSMKGLRYQVVPA